MIVGISGKRGSGKDALGDILCRDHGFVRVAFADPMKAFVQDVFDLPHESVWGPSAMREEVHVTWGRSARVLLQTLGTEWGRAMHPDVWVRYAMRTAKRRVASGVPGVVITDVRFPNELGVIRSEGGATVRIVRPSTERRDDAAKHESETALDWISDDAFSFVVHNEGTLEDLARHGRRIVADRAST